MKPREFLRLVKDGLPSLVLFYGNETAYMNRILSTLKDWFLGETWELNWSVLEGDNLTLEGLKENIGVSPFGSQKRVVVLRNAMDFWKVQYRGCKEAIIRVLYNIPPYTTLIFSHIGEMGKDKPTRELLKIFEEGHYPVVRFIAEQEDLRRWARRRLSKAGVHVDEEGLGWLIEMTEGRMDLLEQELEKIQLSGKLEIRTCNLPPNYQKVASMVYSRDPALLEFLEDLMVTRGHLYLFRILATSVMRVVAVKMVTEEGVSLEDALINVHSSDRELIGRCTKGLSLKEALSLLDSILETEIALKSSPLPPQLILTKLVNRLLGSMVQRMAKAN